MDNMNNENSQQEELGSIPFDDEQEEQKEDKTTATGEQKKAADLDKKGTLASSEQRITGVRTFFTKLHPGAIAFLDEQIRDWLKANPDVRVRRTNTVVGDVQSKKTEPNIIVTIWY